MNLNIPYRLNASEIIFMVIGSLYVHGNRFDLKMYKKTLTTIDV